jgi:hypothetical protein
LCSNCAGDYENPEMTAPPGAGQGSADGELAEDAESYPGMQAVSRESRQATPDASTHRQARDKQDEISQCLPPVAAPAGEVEVAG